MISELPNFITVLPEIAILVFACLALLTHLFFESNYKKGAYHLTLLGLIIAAVLTLSQLGGHSEVSFSGLFIDDDIARLLKLFIYFSVFGAFVYSRGYLITRKIPEGEYYVLGLFSTLGMMILVSAHSLITIYLGLELLTLPLYAMVALRRDCAQATEAALKYFIMGAIASGMLLYGMSMLYGATGSLDITAISQALAETPITQTMIFSFALVFLLVGVGFKLAAAPFHMWAPDVYTGAPSNATLFLATAPKVAAVGMALRLLVFALPELFDRWQELLIVLSVLSLVIGNLFAIAQTNIKRMLAYSAIAHMGYMLLGFIAGTPAGYAASLFYILIYAVMSLAAFGMVVLLSKAGFEAEQIEDFKGLNARSPWLAFLLLLVMFSMAGIPPTVGFFAKFVVIKAIVDVDIIWLAVLALLFATIGAFYYLRIVKTMYFDKPTELSTIEIPRGQQLVMSVNALLVLLLGIFPGVLLQACRAAFGI